MGMLRVATHRRLELSLERVEGLDLDTTVPHRHIIHIICLHWHRLLAEGSRRARSRLSAHYKSDCVAIDSDCSAIDSDFSTVT